MNREGWEGYGIMAGWLDNEIKSLDCVLCSYLRIVYEVARGYEYVTNDPGMFQALCKG